MLSLYYGKHQARLNSWLFYKDREVYDCDKHSSLLHNSVNYTINVWLFYEGEEVLYSEKHSSLLHKSIITRKLSDYFAMMKKYFTVKNTLAYSTIL